MKTTHYIALAAVGSLLTLGACEQEYDSATGVNDTTNPPITDTTSPTSGTRPGGVTDPATAPDNTANNRGDGSDQSRTPIDQSEASEDVKITAEIRRAVLDIDGLSTSAQNCKIITDRAGVVTLRGVVASQAEKDRIAAIATATPGVTRVDNQLEVNPR